MHPTFDFWTVRNEAHEALQAAIKDRAPLSYVFGPGDHQTYFVESAVLPVPGHTSTGSSLPAPAGVVAAGAGSLPRARRLFVKPCGLWRANGSAYLRAGVGMQRMDRRA